MKHKIMFIQPGEDFSKEKALENLLEQGWFVCASFAVEKRAVFVLAEPIAPDPSFAPMFPPDRKSLPTLY